MTNFEKMTKIEKFQMAQEIVGANGENQELVAFLQNEINMLENKYAKRKTSMSKTQSENEVIKTEILEKMENDTKYRASEIGLMLGISQNKASALLNAMVKVGNLKKVSEKRITYFVK